MSSYFGEAKRNSDRLPTAILSVYKQRVRSARMHKVIFVVHYSGRAIIILLPWNTRFYFGHQKPYMNNNKEDLFRKWKINNQILTCQCVTSIYN